MVYYVNIASSLLIDADDQQQRLRTVDAHRSQFNLPGISQPSIGVWAQARQIRPLLKPRDGKSAQDRFPDGFSGFSQTLHVEVVTGLEQAASAFGV